MYGKSNMETYSTICKIDSQREFAVQLRKLKQGLCINLERWNGKADGREVQTGRDICIPIASGPITSMQIDGETVETVADFIFGGSKSTADGDCSHEIKRRLLLGRKVMTNLDSILKSRDITLLIKVCVVKAVVFPVVLYRCELDRKES